MHKGDKVRVWQLGGPGRAMEGELLLVSANGRSLAVAFKDKPDWASGERGFFVGPAPWGVGMLCLLVQDDVLGLVDVASSTRLQIEVIA